MIYIELFNAIGAELFKAVTGRLFTEEQIKAVSTNAVGKHFADFLPEPKDERASRERVEEARDHITKASQIIALLQSELGTQTEQLNAVLNELEEKKQLAQQYQTLATVGQEQFAALRVQMEGALRQELLAQSERGKRLRRIASAILWFVTLVLGAALGAYFKEVVQWLRPIVV